MAKFILSAFADEYSSNLSGQIDGLKKNGINHIEVRGINGKNVSSISVEEANSAKELFFQNNIKVSSIGSPIGKIKITEDFEEHKKIFGKIIDIAQIMETNLIRVFSFYIPEGEDSKNYRDEVFKRMDYLLTTAENNGMTLCHENEAKIYGESPEKCYDLLQNFGGKLKCVFDPGNFVLGGFSTYPEAYEMLKPYIEYFHIKDAKFDGTVVVPGEGEAQIPEILKEHSKSAERILVSLEPHLRFFLGLSELNKQSDVRIENQFQSAEEAFNVAATSFKEIINKI